MEKIKPVVLNAMHESGLLNCPGCYRDIRFILAMVAGMPVLWLIHDYMPVFSSTLMLSWLALLSILIWQPLVEELLFRGIIQGQLSGYGWGKKKLLAVTNANIVTSVMFVAMHIFYGQPVWSLAIFIPSLVFGYFRDAFNSVYPSMLLHSAYNSIVIIGLLINGNLVIGPAST